MSLSILSDIKECHLYLTPERSLYIGRVGEKMHISKAPSVFIISLSGDIAFESDGQQHCVRSLALLPDTTIDIELRGSLIAIFFMDPLGLDYAVLKEDGSETVFLPGQKEMLLEPNMTSPVAAVIGEAFLTRPNAEMLFKSLEAIVSAKRRQLLNSGGYWADERIVKAIKYIRSTEGMTANVEQVATHVNLSVPRFTQLFRSVTGISLRRFKIWYRMYLAIEKIAKGESFTDAAFSAGFSDYAHFSRSFSEMGGVAPSVMLYGSQDLYLDVYEPKGRKGSGEQAHRRNSTEVLL